ncbi:MAG TPA: SAM-dependent methyltransferase, partial [Dehalococcoidia bacterium]|nr:SAM-dependent methyltransferase [Dehalococcoidia bacterium]
MVSPSLTENTQLRAIIERRIRDEGPITFAEFMRLSLYHPDLGYYAAGRPPMGLRADYVTSPEVSSLFGLTIARHVLNEWRAAGEPAAWEVIELGPGSGALARDILDAVATEPALSATLRYTLVESSAALREQQRHVLRAHSSVVDWLPSVAHLEGDLRGHVLSNEFFDAQPFHRVTVEAGKLREIFVGLDQKGNFHDLLGELSTSRLAEYFQDLALMPGEGNLAEVGLEARDTMRLLATKLASGVITTFDYGYGADELYAPWRRQGTLLCFYQQSYADRPYERIGRQDITAHVDFTSLAAAAAARGFESDPLTSQLHFLTDLAIDA